MIALEAGMLLVLVCSLLNTIQFARFGAAMVARRYGG
jgi:hypothetical protein